MAALSFDLVGVSRRQGCAVIVVQCIQDQRRCRTTPMHGNDLQQSNACVGCVQPFQVSVTGNGRTVFQAAQAALQVALAAL